MATYDPTNWKTGDVITATKLNNMENGIANASESANGALQTSGGTMTGNINFATSGNGVTTSSPYLNGNAKYFVLNVLENLSITNLSDITNSGLYYTSHASDFNDVPSGASRSFAILHNAFPNSEIAFQIFIDFYKNKLYMRNKQSGTWSGWAEP